MRISKSRYRSKISLALSVDAPLLSTASAQRRNSGYRPPCPVSRSLSISLCERFSRLPSGPTRASTNSGKSLLTLGKDVYRHVVGCEHPDLHHVGVRHGDAAIGPVVAAIVVRVVPQLVRQTVDHDRAAAVPVPCPRALQIQRVRVRHLDREEVVAAGIAALEAVAAFGRAEVSGALLLSHRAQAERDVI